MTEHRIMWVVAEKGGFYCSKCGFFVPEEVYHACIQFDTYLYALYVDRNGNFVFPSPLGGKAIWVKVVEENEKVIRKGE